MEEVKEYYKSGALKALYYANNGVKNGEYKEYFESGELKEECVYKYNRILSGTYKLYNKAGEIIRTNRRGGAKPWAGRKKLAEEIVHINLLLPKALGEKLEAMAEKEKLSISAFIRKLIDEKI